MDPATMPNAWRQLREIERWERFIANAEKSEQSHVVFTDDGGLRVETPDGFHTMGPDYIAAIEALVAEGVDAGAALLATLKRIQAAHDGGHARAAQYADERKRWRTAARAILARRTRKLSARHLARLVAAELHSDMPEADRDRMAEHRRRWLADLL